MKAWAESLHKAAGMGSKVVWLETDHYFNGLDRAAICSSVIDFMDKELATKKRELRQESLHLRLQQQSGQLEQPSRLRLLRRQVGQMEHGISERAQKPEAEK